MKPKLLIIAGAGASVDFGMPSVAEIDTLFLQWAAAAYPLADGSGDLYGYLLGEVVRFRSEHTPQGDPLAPNFEEMLFALSQLAGLLGPHIGRGALNTLLPFVQIPDLPAITPFFETLQPDDFWVGHLAAHLSDKLLDHFREKCRSVRESLAEAFAKFRKFMVALEREFEVAVVTLNYDDLFSQAMPSLETGFEPDEGRFVRERIINREKWGWLCHLHGSVHFDMDYRGGRELHEISWKKSLAEVFHQNANGRSSTESGEGLSFPTSSIIAGLGKPYQLMRQPFRTYYSELDRLASQADAILFIGYGFGDAHVNAAFAHFTDDYRRPVVVIDYAEDPTLTVGSGAAQVSKAAAMALQIFGVHPNLMAWGGSVIPAPVSELKAAREFEVSKEDGYPLAIWYGGFLEACREPDKVIARLR